ncbi:MAG TPA: hypothetical protein VIP11_07735 [Gemmatimonadaceae bacterium]
MIERGNQRAALGVAHRWIVEPENLKERRACRGNRPFALRVVREGQLRDLARRVIAREHLIAASSPPVRAGVVADR